MYASLLGYCKEVSLVAPRRASARLAKLSLPLTTPIHNRSRHIVDQWAWRLRRVLNQWRVDTVSLRSPIK